MPVCAADERPRFNGYFFAGVNRAALSTIMERSGRPRARKWRVRALGTGRNSLPSRRSKGNMGSGAHSPSMRTHLSEEHYTLRAVTTALLSDRGLLRKPAAGCTFKAHGFLGSETAMVAFPPDRFGTLSTPRNPIAARKISNSIV